MHHDRSAFGGDLLAGIVGDRGRGDGTIDRAHDGPNFSQGRHRDFQRANAPNHLALPDCSCSEKRVVSTSFWRHQLCSFGAQLGNLLAQLGQEGCVAARRMQGI